MSHMQLEASHSEKPLWCALLLSCSWKAKAAGLLSTSLVTHQKQHEASIASSLLPAPLSSKLTLCSVQLSALALDLANLSRSSYSICQLDKGAGSSFFPLRERWIEREKIPQSNSLVGTEGRKKREAKEEKNTRRAVSGGIPSQGVTSWQQNNESCCLMRAHHGHDS